jgi:hypothetical protein
MRTRGVTQVAALHRVCCARDAVEGGGETSERRESTPVQSDHDLRGKEETRGRAVPTRQGGGVCGCGRDRRSSVWTM